MGFLNEELHCTKPTESCENCKDLQRSQSADDDSHLQGGETRITISLTIDVDSAKQLKSWSKQTSLMSNFASLAFVKRCASLFAVGVAFALVLNLLQRQRKVTIFPPGLFGDVLNSAWWVPPTCGIAATLIGLLYPCMDQKLGHPHKFKREWSSVMRCIAVFVGINHASAKINFDNNIQLSLTLAALSIGLWWLFDRSPSGLGLGLVIAALATFVTQVLVALGVFWYSEPDFLYIRSWVPCIFFSGGVTMGTIGRALAVDAEEDLMSQVPVTTAVGEHQHKE